jgi:DNA-binding protein Fis
VARQRARTGERGPSSAALQTGISDYSQRCTRAVLASPGAQTRDDQSLSALVKESLSRAARGESVEVYAELIETVERELFTQAIRLACGNQVRAARWLGISRFTLRHRLQKLGLHSFAKTD